MTRLKLLGFMMFLTANIIMCVNYLSDSYHTYSATKKVQAYMDGRIKAAAVGIRLEAKVSDCVQMPVKNPRESKPWACVVTLTSGSETEVQVLQFSKNNLNGHDDEPEEPVIQFDHSKDTNI